MYKRRENVEPTTGLREFQTGNSYWNQTEDSSVNETMAGSQSILPVIRPTLLARVQHYGNQLKMICISHILQMYRSFSNIIKFTSGKHSTGKQVFE